MTGFDQPRQITSLTGRVREKYNWSKAELARRTRVNARTVARRESGESALEGEALTLYELMSACKDLDMGWLVEKVTSGAFSTDSLRLELKKRGGDIVVSIEDIISVLVESQRRLESMNINTFNFNSSKTRLIETIALLNAAMAEVKRFQDEDESD